MPSRASIYSKTCTATNDNPFQVDSEERTVLTSINIAVYTNDAYYGNAADQAGIIRANAVTWFDTKCKVADLYFKNVIAGQNTTVVITGTQEAGSYGI